MVAYNQCSGNTSLQSYSSGQPTGDAGGMGRKGAQKVIIFETDGAPNTRADATLFGAGADSYYPVRIKNPADFNDPSNVEWPNGGSYADQDVYNVVTQICKLETASPPGFSTARKPALVYPIGYVSLFDPSNPSQGQADAFDFLQNVAFRGNTAMNTSGSSFPDAHRVYGTNQQRIDRIRQAFTDIMQTGVQVSLIE